MDDFGLPMLLFILVRKAPQNSKAACHKSVWLSKTVKELTYILPGRLPRPFFLLVHAQLARLRGLSGHKARVPGEPSLTWPAEPTPGNTPAAYQRQQPDQSESGHAHTVGPTRSARGFLAARADLPERVSMASLLPLRRPCLPHRQRCFAAPRYRRRRRGLDPAPSSVGSDTPRNSRSKEM